MKNNFNILVATDYSKSAETAEKYALQLAQSTRSAITFLHIFQESASYPSEFVDLEDMDDSPVEFELRKLEQHVMELMESIKIAEKDVTYNCRVSKGNPTAEILRAAGEEKADFVVVGTHGAGAIQRTFFGSHTWDVIKKAGVPVLAIPMEASYSKVQNIVFATEYRPSEIPLITFLTEFARWFNAELTVLHVASNVFSAGFEREMFERFKKEVQDKVNYEKLSIRLINDKNLVDGLNGFCVRTRSSWLIMSHEKASLLISMFNPVSFTKKMSFYTHVPLFAIPDGYKPKDAEIKKMAEHGDIEAEDFFVG